MNTYRKKIKCFFKKYYIQLNTDKQQKIKNMIQQNTNYQHTEFIFEYEKLNKNNSISIQICNNYQLGNFCVFPKGKINLSRSYSPYNDNFDIFLKQVELYYSNKLTENMVLTPLQKDIISCSTFFDSFNIFTNYIKANYFDDYIENGSVIDISKENDFESYLKKSNELIQKRGERIYKILQKS